MNQIYFWRIGLAFTCNFVDPILTRSISGPRADWSDLVACLKAFQFRWSDLPQHRETGESDPKLALFKNIIINYIYYVWIVFKICAFDLNKIPKTCLLACFVWEVTWTGRLDGQSDEETCLAWPIKNRSHTNKGYQAFCLAPWHQRSSCSVELFREGVARRCTVEGQNTEADLDFENNLQVVNMFQDQINEVQKGIKEQSAKRKALKNLDLFVLDNSLRETTVGQLRGHTMENKWKIYNEVWFSRSWLVFAHHDEIILVGKLLLPFPDSFQSFVIICAAFSKPLMQAKFNFKFFTVKTILIVKLQLKRREKWHWQTSKQPGLWSSFQV